MDFVKKYDFDDRPKRAMELLKAVELEAHGHKLPAEVSGGQQQRVAIARALATDPSILVADEPTGRLDLVTAEVILQIFENLVAQGKTIVMVTHDRSVVGRVTRMLELKDGEVLPHASA